MKILSSFFIVLLWKLYYNDNKGSGSMEYLILGLLFIILIFLIFLLLKNGNESNITERIGKLETSLVKELGDFKGGLTHDLNEDFKELNDRMDKKIHLLNDKVNERLDQNFEKTNKAFTSVLERLSRIDEAQKKIDHLSSDIVSLQGILTDKKTRGIFGEINLKHILSSVFGENNNKIYEMQYTFLSGAIADCVIHAPEPLGMIAIDSKFPLENYQAMVDKKNSEAIRMQAEKLFKSDMKKHIDAIATKYIIKGVTNEQAILFLPAEAIFAEINAYHRDIIEYSYKKHVWITSPTTLISTLTTLQLIMKNAERDKYAAVIHQELKLLDEEFGRYKDRWDKLYRSIETVSKDVKDIHVTTDKITKRFNAINQVEMGKIDYEE